MGDLQRRTTSPEEYGNYYAWGETSPKSEYTEDNCKTWCKSMGDISGSSSYDAARANWGGSWRMPTKAEFEELLNNCNWEWTSQGGHYGHKLTSKKNRKSIFLPAAGWCYWTSVEREGRDGMYWSSTPNESHDSDAYSHDFYGGDIFINCPKRIGGRSIRPVSD